MTVFLPEKHVQPCRYSDLGTVDIPSIESI